MHFVYILYSDSLNKFYVGSTEDLATRLAFHNKPIEQRKFTARGIPWRVMASFQFPDKSIALKVEKYIKRMKSRKFIEDINKAEIQPETLLQDEGLINC